MVDSVSTKATAMPMPKAVSIFFDTPKNGQIPRNCDRTILLTNIADMNMSKNSMSLYFFIFLFVFLLEKMPNLEKTISSCLRLQ